MKNLWIKGALLALLVAVFMAMPEKASAQILNLTFCRITDNAPTDVANQLIAHVFYSSGTNEALFEFHNVGSVSSSITGVFFDDGTILGAGTPSIFNGTGVNFVEDPGANFPGGNTLTPPFVEDFSFRSKAKGGIQGGVQGAGVNNLAVESTVNEVVRIGLGLNSGVSFSDVIDALNDGSLRIGLHIQGIPIGTTTTSDSYVNCPAPIPEPGTLILLGTGLLASGGIARLRRKK